jgi:hypothetical protein
MDDGWELAEFEDAEAVVARSNALLSKRNNSHNKLVQINSNWPMIGIDRGKPIRWARFQFSGDEPSAAIAWLA